MHGVGVFVEALERLAVESYLSRCCCAWLDVDALVAFEAEARAVGVGCATEIDLNNLCAFALACVGYRNGEGELVVSLV